MLAGDLAHPHDGHDPVPFLCLCDSNTEARVMYEAGVRYVIQSESLAVQPPCLTLTRPPCANARTRKRLEPVDALCVCTRVHTSHRSYDTAIHGANSCRLFFSTKGRAIRRQMHNYNSLEKSTFMEDYIRLHKADMEEEQSNENRKQLAQFVGHDRRASTMLSTKP